MQASVKYAANGPKQYAHGLRINVVITMPDGSEKKLWGNPDDPVLTALRKGQAVEVFTDKKGNLQLDTSSLAAQPAPAQHPAPAAGSIAGFSVPPVEVKQNMLEYITFSAKLFKHCFDEAGNEMQDVNLPDGDLRAVATTLYLSAMRRYNLQ